MLVLELMSVLMRQQNRPLVQQYQLCRVLPLICIRIWLITIRHSGMWNGMQALLTSCILLSPHLIILIWATLVGEMVLYPGGFALAISILSFVSPRSKRPTTNPQCTSCDCALTVVHNMLLECHHYTISQERDTCSSQLILKSYLKQSTPTLFLILILFTTLVSTIVFKPVYLFLYCS